jgi:hypothetical protein
MDSDFSLQRLGFNTRGAHAEFTVVRLTIMVTLNYSCQIIIPPMIRTYMLPLLGCAVDLASQEYIETSSLASTEIEC